MTLGDRTAEAMASWIGDSLSGVTVTNRIEEERTTQTGSRIIVETTGCEERAPHLRHLFDINGRIILRQSADSENAETAFRNRCLELRNLIRDGELVEQSVNSQDGRLQLYARSFHAASQEESSGSRGFQAIFNWRALARDNPNN